MLKTRLYISWLWLLTRKAALDVRSREWGTTVSQYKFLALAVAGILTLIPGLSILSLVHHNKLAWGESPHRHERRRSDEML